MSSDAEIRTLNPEWWTEYRQKCFEDVLDDLLIAAQSVVCTILLIDELFSAAPLCFPCI